MKKVAMIAMFAGIFAVSFSSCRDKKELTQEEQIIQEMQDEGANIEVKEQEDGDTKIKMETDEKEVKIKTDADGDSKIKVDEKNN